MLFLLEFFVETMRHFFQNSLTDGKHKEQNLFKIEIFCNIINAFTATLKQSNESLLDNSINIIIIGEKPNSHQKKRTAACKCLSYLFIDLLFKLFTCC